MENNSKSILPTLAKYIDDILQLGITANRRETLQVLIGHIQDTLNQGLEMNLNFICTHNSRRSQLSQLWAQTAAHSYGLPVNCFSGGIEVTAFNERAVATIERAGFDVSFQGAGNPLYSVVYAEDMGPLVMFSKNYNDRQNPRENFIAVMTCSHAEENCPFISGADKRISLFYNDPKEFDDSDVEQEKYDERSAQIAMEMFYVFSKITT